jgi:hypothetical protein
MRRLLHRSLHQQPLAWFAAGQTRWRALPPSGRQPALPPVRTTGTAGGVRFLAAQPGHVQQRPDTCPALSAHPGTGHTPHIAQPTGRRHPTGRFAHSSSVTACMLRTAPNTSPRCRLPTPAQSMTTTTSSSPVDLNVARPQSTAHCPQQRPHRRAASISFFPSPPVLPGRLKAMPARPGMSSSCSRAAAPNGTSYPSASFTPFQPSTRSAMNSVMLRSLSFSADCKSFALRRLHSSLKGRASGQCST